MTKIEKISEIIREYENGCDSAIEAIDILEGIKNVLNDPTFTEGEKDASDDESADYNEESGLYAPLHKALDEYEVGLSIDGSPNNYFVELTTYEPNGLEWTERLFVGTGTLSEMEESLGQILSDMNVDKLAESLVETHVNEAYSKEMLYEDIRAIKEYLGLFLHRLNMMSDAYISKFVL